MRVIAELVVDSTYHLAEGQDQIKIINAENNIDVVIKNNPKAGPFAKEALVVEMIYEAPNLDSARDQALDNMATVLNALARVTGGRFDFVNVVRAIDWTPGLIDREARYYLTARATPSHPILDNALAKTAERIMAMHNDDVSQTVLRWYRLGRRAQGPEEQFMYLWFAIEVAAGALKEPGKIAIACPKCQSDLFCETCDDTPRRRRVETEAIMDLIRSVAPPEAKHDEIFKTLSKIRNTLHHGRRLHTITHELPCTVDQALHVTAQVAWRAISRLANQDADPDPDGVLHFMQIEDVVNNQMVVSATVSTRFDKGDPNNPQLTDAPLIDVSIVVDGKNYSYDGQEEPG